MKVKFKEFMEKTQNYWSERTPGQKGMLIGSVTIGIGLITLLSFLVFRPNYTPLYNNLSMQEVSQIKQELETRGVPYEITANGTSISVPKDQVNNLLVDLAGEGLPKSGGIDYSFFSENSSWGITDNEFNMMKLDAMQTELANLIKGIEGINDAKVLINLPKESIFVSQAQDEASASIILHTDIGYEFKENQIESLYHLVSKAIPNLSPENIVIRNQYLEFFDLASAGRPTDEYAYQQSIKNDIERDIRQRLQQMLDTMIGLGKVIVSVTADVDFTAENRVEELVEPVDLENMEGLPVSIETIHETYSGGSLGEGIVGSGEDDIPNYPALDQGADGEYELVKEMINNEFNRIRKNIVESPYKIRDLGIQIAVDRVQAVEDGEVQYLSPQDQLSVEEGIESILNSIISTSIDKDYGEVNTDEKISIVFQEFSSSSEELFPSTQAQSISTWLYALGIGLIIIIIGLIFIMFNRKSKKEKLLKREIIVEEERSIPDLEEQPETESEIRRKQLEIMAKDNSEDFVKLLRSWMVDD